MNRGTGTSTDPVTKHWTTKAYESLTSPLGRLIRYAVVLAVIVLAVIGFLNQWFVLCEVVTSDTDGVTRTCAGPDLTSASVLAAVLLVFLLLWPDLSEFSAFGVTLKKLVEKVDETVTETNQKVGRIEVQAAGIDRTTIATNDTAGALQGDLREIRTTLQSLAESRWAAVDRPLQSGGASGPTSRWDAQDDEALRALCAAILGQEVLDEAMKLIIDRTGSPPSDGLSDLLDGRLDAYLVQVAGVLILQYRRVAAQSQGYSDYQQRGEQVDRLLRLVDQLIRAYMDGKRVDVDTIRIAAATLLRLDNGSRQNPLR